MPQKTFRSKNGLRRMRGFTLIEIIVVLAIIMIITAVATPSFVRTIQNYRLTDVATQVTGNLKSARFEAIKRDALVDWKISQTGNTTTVWVDPDRDGVFDGNDKGAIFNTDINVVAAANAPPGLSGQVGVAALTAVGPGNGTITFDSRGAVTGAPAVYVVYVSDSPTAGNYFRAVILLPSGITQVWSAGTAGAWQQLN